MISRAKTKEPRLRIVVSPEGIERVEIWVLTVPTGKLPSGFIMG